MTGGAVAAGPSCLSVDAGDVAAMAASVRACGFGALPGGLSPEMLAALRAEAEASLGTMKRAESAAGLCYRARMCGLGPVAFSVLEGAEMSGLLGQVFGGRFMLSRHISCLTHYGSADHLGAHLDKPAEDCTVTVLLYLRARSPAPGAAETGLVLKVYGEAEDSIGAPRLSIPTTEGTVVLGHGSRVWHERPPLQPGEDVIAITGCYRACAG